jgi:hypothetical protein
VTPDPKPISPSLEQRFRDVLAKVPAGKHILVGATATTQGVEGYGSVTVGTHGSIVGWGGREWATKDVSAGIRTEWSW